MSTRQSHGFPLPAAVVGCLLALAAGLAVAAPAHASSSCRTLKPKAKSAPYLIEPCDRATVDEHRSVTFVVYDSNAQTKQSTRDWPYLDLATTRNVTDGQLAATTNGTGVFQQLSPRAGHKDEWTLTVDPQIYRSWWDNYAGTRYVQVRQLDPAAVDGVIDSPIVTLSVAAPRR